MEQQPMPKWKSDAEKYSKNCKKALALSTSIRYVGVINKYGRTLVGFMRPGAYPMLGREEAKNTFFLMATMVNMQAASESSIGRLEHILLRYKKVKAAIIPRGDVLYYVSVASEEPQYMDLVRHIKKIVQQDASTAK